jgi:hypothetical protein
MFPTQSVLVAIVALCGLLVAATPSLATADGEVTGLVTVGGKPLSAGKITFHRENGQFVGSKVKDGKYTIDHVPAGKVKVTVEGKGVETVYSLEKTTPLVVEIKEGATTFDFTLK